MSAAASIDLQFAERPLASGLTAVAVRNPGIPTLAVSISLHVGQLDEGEGEHGLACFAGTCLEEGTGSKDSVALAEAVESIGGALSTSESGARVMCPATEVESACSLVREVALDPGFRPADVDRVRQDIVTEIEADLAEPTTVAGQRFREEVYGAHPYARAAYGSREAIEAYTVDDLRAFHAKWFRPARGYVAIAGPFECERSLDYLASTFADFTGPSPDPVEADPPPLPDATRRVHLPMDREQVHVYVGHPGIRRDHPDFHELLVMDHVLGTGPGFTARIPKRLRDELGLCYSVSASITATAGLEPGTMRAYIGTSAEHRDTAVDGFLEAIREIQAEPPSADELSVAQDYLAGSFVLGLERNANLVTYAVRAKRYGFGFDYLREYPERVRRVTAEQVTRVAAEHLFPDRVVIVSAGAG